MTFSAAEQAVFDQEVTKYFGDLKESGFNLSGAFRATDPLLGEKLMFEIRRQDINRGLQIDLLRSPDGKREVLTVFLEKGGTGGFMLGTYLKQQDETAVQLASRLDVGEYVGTLREKVSGVLATARLALDRYLTPALSGDEWPHVPVDWGDYK